MNRAQGNGEGNYRVASCRLMPVRKKMTHVVMKRDGKRNWRETIPVGPQIVAHNPIQRAAGHNNKQVVSDSVGHRYCVSETP